MGKKQRLLVGVFGALATLVFAGAAFASYTPKLVAGAAGGHARVGVVVGASDDPTAKVTMYVPSGYAVATPAPGTTLGNVTATAAAADLGGAVLPLTGTLQAIAPNATTNAAAQACGVSPAQTWDLHLSAAGQTLDIPLFVVTAAGPEAASGFVTKLVVCLPPPDVPAGTPGRATFGAKLLSATFTSSAITEPTAGGDYRWTSLWTPYNPGKGTPNAAATVEVQSVHHLPVTLTTKVTKKKITTHRIVKVKGKKKRVAVVKTLVRYSSSVSGGTAAFTTTAAGKRVGAASGAFLISGLRSVKVVVTAKVDSSSGAVPTGTPTASTDLFYRDLGSAACTPTAIFGGLPCIDATSGGQTLKKTVTVVAFR